MAIAQCYFTAHKCGGTLLWKYSKKYTKGYSNFLRSSAQGMCMRRNSLVYFNGDTLFTERWSQHYGSGISLWESEIRIQGDTTFSNNCASIGGAIQAFKQMLI